MLNMTLLHQNKICCNWFIIHYHLFFLHKCHKHAVWWQWVRTTRLIVNIILIVTALCVQHYFLNFSICCQCRCVPHWFTIFWLVKSSKNACLSLTPYKHWWICVCNSFVSWCDTQGFRYFYCHCGNNWYLILHWLFI